MQPPVRDLQSLIAEQQQGLQPQYDLINKDIAANDVSGAAQVAGLNAQKTQAFSDITQGAQNKGMLFSGFSPDQQAKYTASTYLPALAQLQGTIAQTRSNLLGKKTDLGTKAFDVATNERNQDLSTLSDWQKMTAQQQFDASEADKTRVFTAQQNEQNRAAQSASRASDQVTPQEAALSAITKGLGGDGFVSPSTFQVARDLYKQAGGDVHQFANEFWKYTGAGTGQKNQANWKAYYNG